MVEIDGMALAGLAPPPGWASPLKQGELPDEAQSAAGESAFAAMLGAVGLQSVSLEPVPEQSKLGELAIALIRPDRNAEAGIAIPELIDAAPELPQGVAALPLSLSPNAGASGPASGTVVVRSAIPVAATAPQVVLPPAPGRAPEGADASVPAAVEAAARLAVPTAGAVLVTVPSPSVVEEVTQVGPDGLSELTSPAATVEAGTTLRPVAVAAAVAPATALAEAVAVAAAPTVRDAMPSAPAVATVVRDAMPSMAAVATVVAPANPPVEAPAVQTTATGTAVGPDLATIDVVAAPAVATTQGAAPSPPIAAAVASSVIGEASTGSNEQADAGSRAGAGDFAFDPASVGPERVDAATELAPGPAQSSAASTTSAASVASPLASTAPTVATAAEGVAAAAGVATQPAAVDQPVADATVPTIETATSPTRVGSQLADSVQQAVRVDGRELRLLLNPPELGRLEVRVTDTSDGIRVALVATTREAGELIQQHLPFLRASLEARELQVDRLDVSVELRDGGSDGAPRDRNAAGNEGDDGPVWSPVAGQSSSDDAAEGGGATVDLDRSRLGTGTLDVLA